MIGGRTRRKSWPGGPGQEHGNFPSSDSRSLINLTSPDETPSITNMHSVRGHLLSGSYGVGTSTSQAGRITLGATLHQAVTELGTEIDCPTGTTNDD